MTTKYVTYCTPYKPACAFVPDAPVIICVQDDALIIQFEPPCGLPLTTLLGTICSAAQLTDGCQRAIYQYTLAYDDAQITDPNTRPLVTGDIVSFLCQDCLTDYIQQQISCVEGGGSSLFTPLFSGCATDGACEEGGEGGITLFTYNIPASTFTECGIRVDYKATGSMDIENDGDTVSVGIILNGTLTDTFEFTGDTGAFANWEISGSIIAAGAGSAGNECIIGSNKITAATTSSSNVLDTITQFEDQPNQLPIAEEITLTIFGRGVANSVSSCVRGNAITVDLIGPATTCEDCACE